MACHSEQPNLETQYVLSTMSSPASADSNMREMVDRTPPASPLIPGSFINQGVYVLDRKVVELASLAESLREKWTASRVSLAEAALDLNQGSVSMAAEAEDTSRQSDVTASLLRLRRLDEPPRA